MPHGTVTFLTSFSAYLPRFFPYLPPAIRGHVEPLLHGSFFQGVTLQIEKPTAVDCEQVSVLTFRFISLKTNFISKMLGKSAVDF